MENKTQPDNREVTLETSETPEVAETPETTETPEVTQTPETTETPEVTQTPETTEESKEPKRENAFVAGAKKLFQKGIPRSELTNYEKREPTEEELKDNILIVEHLKKYFPVETNLIGQPIRYLKAVDDVSLKIPYGKTLGIVGESGCGKTTLGRTLLGLYGKSAGEVWFNGQNITNYRDRQMNTIRKDMQVIFQDPYSSLSPRFTVGGIISEGVAVHKIVPKAQIKEYVISIMERCGLQPQYYERYPYEFSGGQRQRICIARALAVKPKFVVCDEPVSALDVSIQAQILNLLKELQREMQLAYMFISHDLSVVQHVSDSVGVMYLGSMVECGPTDRIFENPMHPYTKSLLSAVPIPDPRRKQDRVILQGSIPSPANPPSGCRFHTRCPNAMEICSKQAPVYKAYESDHYCACHLYSQE